MEGRPFADAAPPASPEPTRPDVRSLKALGYIGDAGGDADEGARDVRAREGAEVRRVDELRRRLADESVVIGQSRQVESQEVGASAPPPPPPPPPRISIRGGSPRVESEAADPFGEARKSVATEPTFSGSVSDNRFSAGRDDAPAAQEVPKPAAEPAPEPEAEGPLYITRNEEVDARFDEQKRLMAPRLQSVAPGQPGTAIGEHIQVETVPGPAAPPSTGGTDEPNDAPYGDVFFRHYGVNPFLDPEEDRLSTFALDVDTGSWGVVRRYLDGGHLPPAEAVRVEEIVNALDYGDPAPEEGDFALHADGAPTPFGGGDRYRLLRFALKAREVDPADRKPAALTFVVDVSGSMGQENRLGMVKASLGLLLDELRPDDRVALVVYGSRGRVVLAPTADKEALRATILGLYPEGATNAEEGLALGYDVASAALRPGAINRIILASDGVANVGATGPDSILARVRAEAARGIELTTLGFGMGNYNDVLMERLADDGDGRYAYLDTLEEARRVLVEELTGTLQTVAEEARAQVEFNPEVVERYRLLGYENRDLADERFRDDTADAGEIGAGHTVTALYEIKLREQATGRGGERAYRDAPVATLRLRWRPEGAEGFVETERALTLGELAERWERASPALRLAGLAAEYAELLRGSYWAREGSLDEVFRGLQRLQPELTGDPRAAELAALAGKAARLAPEPARALRQE
jgi:Ca-activated chloride channel family protein